MAAKKMKRKAIKKVDVTIKAPSIKDPLTKGALVRTLADMTGKTKKDATMFMQAFAAIVESHVKPKGPGKFVLPGLLKITVVKKPAKPARKGINPFTGEEMMFKAKPAHKVVKIKPLKPLKEKVE